MSDGMKRKAAPYNDLLGDLAGNPLLETFVTMANLKTLYRQGWIDDAKRRDVPVETCESVADHAYGVVFLAHLVASEKRPELDLKKVLELALIHDLPEAIAGDAMPGQLSDAEKQRREKEGLKQVFRGLPDADRYLALFDEYERNETPEAQFVKQIDKLEMGIQALLYEKRGAKELGAFFPYVAERVTSPELIEIVREIEQSRTR